MKAIKGTNIGVIATDKPYKNNTSGVKGISFIESRQKWEVKIQFQKKSILVGRFSDFEEAKRQRKFAEEKYFGKVLKGE